MTFNLKSWVEMRSSRMRIREREEKRAQYRAPKNSNVQSLTSGDRKDTAAEDIENQSNVLIWTPERESGNCVHC